MRTSDETINDVSGVDGSGECDLDSPYIINHPSLYESFSLQLTLERIELEKKSCFQQQQQQMKMR